MNPKVLLVIAIVLVLLIGAAVAVGATSGGGQDGADPAGWVSAVGKRAVAWLDRATARQRGGPRLSDRDVTGVSADSCRDLLILEQLSLLPGERCTYEVAKSKERMRALPLLLARGEGLEVDLVLYREEDWENDLSLNRGACEDLQFFERGGRMALSCVDGGSDTPCRVEIPPEGCP